MPELPEVETYVRELAPELRGRTVAEATVSWPRIVAEPSVDSFLVKIVGQKFVSFSRRGKYMLLGLSGGDTFIVHLRMTGKLLIQPSSAEAGKHTHGLFGLDDGRCLFYNDSRKFGRLWLVADPASVVGGLGPEPLSDDFDIEWLAGKLSGRTASIKALLLDQSIAAGVGNIYADEALFAARIHPRRAGGQISETDLSNLRDSVRGVLKDGIRRQGSSLGGSAIQNYVRPGGESGGFQEEFKVFRKTSEPCPICGTSIERCVLAQRSTHFCPRCQK